MKTTMMSTARLVSLETLLDPECADYSPLNEKMEVTGSEYVGSATGSRTKEQDRNKRAGTPVIPAQNAV